jgi:septum formation protein
MSSARTALLSAFSRTDNPRRETLRTELAKAASREQDVAPRPKLVLASIDETPKKGEMPRALVARLARAKAEAARDQIANDRDIADAYVLAADTIVSNNLKIFGKPQQVEEAVEFLNRLSGRSHRVLTAVCLITPQDRVRSKIVDTKVRFKYLSKAEIEAYVASREWRDKAGGYAIQGLAGAFVQKIKGSYTNVVGLPLTEVVAMLVGEGFPIHFNWIRAAEADRD